MKEIINGIVYRVTETSTHRIVAKADPVLRDDAPDLAALGLLTINLRLEDFDGEPRRDSGELTFAIEGTPVVRSMVDGAAALTLDLASLGPIEIKLIDPRPCDAQMRDIVIEVTR